MTDSGDQGLRTVKDPESIPTRELQRMQRQRASALAREKRRATKIEERKNKAEQRATARREKDQQIMATLKRGADLAPE